MNILIAGDKNSAAKQMKDALRKEAQFLVRIISFEKKALDQAVSKGVDLIILNPESTYMEATDIYYAVKKEAATEDIPIIFVIDEREMQTADLPSGVQEILYRPLKSAEVVARIKHVLKRIHKTDQKNVIHRGKLVVDIAKYEVYVQDKKIDLTYTEFELLKFLSSNEGTVFTREVLLNKVWGYEYYGGTRTVDVHIRRLRSKIEGRSTAFIETVRNIGYKFISEEA